MSAVGYLSSFAVTYQIEGVTEAQARAIAAAVERTLNTNLAELIGAAAEAPVLRAGWQRDWADRAVLGVQVERRGDLVEEYDVR